MYVKKRAYQFQPKVRDEQLVLLVLKHKKYQLYVIVILARINQSKTSNISNQNIINHFN